ncbi:hypothetical protein [Fodinicurvata sediminis]|uniref:hypothetical protein n=1 Tax=Fodinicurvata sediminis TaxID=1121832 RepID=UPI0003B76C0C|nr:hypothetical protein [Fodinicurvata sediminis]
MKILSWSLSAFLLATPAAVAAETMPLPETDFEGEWADPGADSSGMKVRYSSDLETMRVEGQSEGASGGMLRNMRNGEMTIWSDQMGEQALQGQIDDMGLMEGENTGETKTVNGETCTIWEVQGSQTCLTDDHIPMEVEHQQGHAVLRNLQRTAQDDSYFSPPEGLEIVPMPDAMKKMMEQAGEEAPF